MKLEEIEEMWTLDAANLADEDKFKQNSLRISSYHAKYDNILSKEQAILIKLQRGYNRIKMTKYNIISDGASSKKALEEDLDIPRKMIKSKTEADIYLDGNSVLSEAREIMEMCQLKIEKLQRIITRINNLHWDYKNYISMIRFENGS
jgi:hypothetical protein